MASFDSESSLSKPHPNKNFASLMEPKLASTPKPKPKSNETFGQSGVVFYNEAQDKFMINRKTLLKVLKTATLVDHRLSS